MKRRIISALLLIYFLQTAVLNIPSAMAGYTCSWLGYGRNDASYSPSYQSCDATFEECEAYRLALPTVSACESECWKIRRWNWCERYEGCLANIDEVLPGSGEEKYMQCIESCRSATYETPPDCLGELKKCCLDTYNDMTAAPETDTYGDDDTADGEDTGDAETYCPEGYVPEDGVCVAASEDPQGDYNIYVDPDDFTLPADGSSSQSITAYVRDKNGAAAGFPVWIELYNPNNINPGTLEIETGEEGAGDTRVSAVYTAPEIKSSQKTEASDEIKDLIYVFAEIEGEKAYKAVDALLIAQAEGFVVDITIEKKGFKTKTLQASFDKGSLSGSPYILTGKNKNPVNNARVTLKGTLPDAQKTEINLSTVTENGTFWFERLGEEGENNIGDIEMELEDEPAGYYKKGIRYGDSLKMKATASGFTKAPGENFLNDLDALVAMLADKDEKDALNIMGAIKMTAYALYFTEYYSQKAYESMQNYREYMTNVLKDTVGFVTGIWNITGGMFNAAQDKSGVIGKYIVQWAGKEGKNSFSSAFKGAFNMVVAQLKKGISMDTAANKHYMGYLNEFLGAMENVLITASVNAADDASSSIKKRFDSYLKNVYYRDISGVLEKFKVDPDNMPADLDARIKTAEEIFKSNTEAHNRRNAIQYEWDFDTALLTEFVNVSKPFAKIYLMTHYPDAVTVGKAVDMAGHAFNALKVAASVNHVIEWNALYYEDITSLYMSLGILYSGKVTIERSGGDIQVITAQAGSAGGPVPVARALEAVDRTAGILSQIAGQIEDNDEAGLESQLQNLSSARKDLAESNAEVIEKINAGMGLLESGDMADALETEALLGSMEMENYLMDIRLLSLAADDSPENLEDFRGAVEDFAESRAQALEFSRDVIEKIDAAVLAEAKNNNFNPSIMTYAIMAAAGIILLAGLTIFIVLSVRKKTLAAVIVLGGALVAGILLGAYGYDRMNKETPDQNNVISIPGFGDFDDDVLAEDDEAVDSEEDAESGDAGEAEDEPADEDNNENIETDEAEDENGTADDEETADDEVPADDAANEREATDSGRIYNEEFGYSLEVGEEAAGKLVQLTTDDPFYSGSVVYCYELSDAGYEDWTCGNGMIQVFMIALMNDAQYAEESAGPYYTPEYDLGKHNGFHYMFSHPNGDFPDEVLPLVRSFGDIAASIEF